MNNHNIQQILQSLTQQEKQELFEVLSQELPRHKLEESLGLSAEVVLEAIVTIQKQGGLTWRMLKGVLAEITWGSVELPKYPGWSDITPPGDLPFDYLIRDNVGEIKVQVKLQRSEKGIPLKRDFSGIPDRIFCVETQKTRGGKDATTGEKTRPYRFGEFDVLAVSFLPSTNKWDNYRYTVANWLIPSSKDQSLIDTFQPVSTESDADWTDSLDVVAEWFRSGIQKRIGQSNT